jgi:hypothetical protein
VGIGRKPSAERLQETAAMYYVIVAGVNHALRPHKNSHEKLAMSSDLLMAIVLLSACSISVFAHR